MKSFSNYVFKSNWSLLSLLIVLLLFSCKKEEDTMVTTSDPVASFQFEVSTTNFFQVTFTNFSKNATSYSWDFGDGNNSTDKDPVHIYDAAGSFDVVLTATGGGKSATRTTTVNITDPDTQLSMLAGSTSKTWYLQREGIAMGIGANPNETNWWSFGGVTPLGDRPCILDDQYIFHRDGTFEFESNGTIFVDAEANGGWLGPAASEDCYDEAGNLTSSAGDDLSAFGNGGSYTYEFDNANSTITLLGAGAYIGLAPKTSGGDNFIPISSKEYKIFNFAPGAIADSLQMSIIGADFAWNFYLVHYHNESDLPDIPTSMPTAAFNVEKQDFTVTCNNTSSNSTSYMWDFGDGVGTSTDENPTYTYAAEGNYTITLTAMDDNSNSDMTSQEVIVSSATFTAAALSSATGRVWRLAGAQSYIVGPAPNDGEWWGGIDDQGVIDRACQMDDEFIFIDGGTFNVDTKGQVWAEAYMGGTDACIDDSAVPAPYNTLTSGMHTFEVIEVMGEDPKIRVIGTGAYLGFSKPFNGGEIGGTDANPPASEITYTVFDYSASATKASMTVVIDYSAAQDGSAWWTMKLEADL